MTNATARAATLPRRMKSLKPRIAAPPPAYRNRRAGRLPLVRIVSTAASARTRPAQYADADGGASGPPAPAARSCPPGHRLGRALAPRRAAVRDRRRPGARRRPPPGLLGRQPRPAPGDGGRHGAMGAPPLAPSCASRDRAEGPGGHPGAAKVIATVHISHGLAPDAPMVLLVHGYAVPMPLLDALVARSLRARGAHSMRIDLPFHLRRRMPGHSSGDGFFGTDPARIRATVRQSVEDAAALVAWARANVTPTVAVLGVSLGGPRLHPARRAGAARLGHGGGPAVRPSGDVPRAHAPAAGASCRAQTPPAVAPGAPTAARRGPCSTQPWRRWCRATSSRAPTRPTSRWCDPSSTSDRRASTDRRPRGSVGRRALGLPVRAHHGDERSWGRRPHPRPSPRPGTRPRRATHRWPPPAERLRWPGSCQRWR